MILIALFATMSVAFVSDSTMNARKSTNIVHLQNARLQAESGLTYLYYLIHKNGTAAKSGTAVLDELAQKLPTWLGNSLNGQAIVYANGQITIPAISAGGTGSFSAVLSLDDAQTLRIAVPGAEGGAARSVRVLCSMAGGRAAACGFGIASRGPVNLTGNARISGANSSAEGSILSATYTTTTAVSMNGNCNISGDVSLSNPQGAVSLIGNTSIGGEASNSAHLQDHVHIGVGDVAFPTADPSVFKPFATNIVDRNTSTNGNKTFTNILIKANTNPTFTGNITLKGVVYIETPNKVTFAGNLNMQGVVATDDAGTGNLSSNGINFTGNTSIAGVESLPDTPEFHGLKQLPGTFLLAPGFSVGFAGNFGTIGGALAANEFKWNGNASGVVKGCVINWGDTPFSLTGNSSLIFDRGNDTGGLPGLVAKTALTASPDSYEEY